MMVKESDVEQSSEDNHLVLHMEKSKSYCDSDRNAGRQLFIGYLLLKLCKERGIPFNCFIQVATRLYGIFEEYQGRLDCGVLGSLTLCSSFVSRMNSSTNFIDDIMEDYLKIPLIQDIVYMLYGTNSLEPNHRSVY